MCLTPHLLFQVGHEGEEESDIFTIREVSFQPTGESDWKDTNYTLNTDSLDWVSADKAALAAEGAAADLVPLLLNYQ